jgi:hypothetical protein
MDHQRIEDGSVVEAYVTDRLGETERTEFETHLVECPKCLDQVEAAQDLAAGLRALGSPAASVGTLPTLRRWSTAVLGWALAASVFAVLAIGWGVKEQRRLRLVAQAAERQAAAAEARADELARQAPEPRVPEAPVNPSVRPPGPVPVLTLLATRGTDLPTLKLPREGGPVVLSVERESPPRFSRYDVRLSREGGGEVLAGLFPPSSRDALALAVDSELLPPGTYLLALEGETASGRRTQLSGHRFRVVR